MRSFLSTAFLLGSALAAPQETVDSASSIGGGIFAPQCKYGDDPTIIRHTGAVYGQNITYQGIKLYETKPSCRQPQIGVVYLTDAFGIEFINNRLLADSFARAGFYTVIPDILQGDPAPFDLATPGFNSTAWTLLHGPAAVDPIITKGIQYLQSKGFTRIGVAGYCFGGKYTFRHITPTSGATAGFAAHPSFLDNTEILAIGKPVSVAEAEIDAMNPPPRRAEVEALLANNTTQPYQVNLYGGTAHGFTTRGDVSVPEVKFGKEGAFYQAVRWFSAWA